MPPATLPRDSAQEAERADHLRQAVTEALEQYCQQHLPDHADCTRVLREDISPVRGVCAVAKDAGADLLVVATHGRTGLRRMLVGSVAEGIVRHASCNVLVVRSES